MIDTQFSPSTEDPGRTDQPDRGHRRARLHRGAEPDRVARPEPGGQRTGMAMTMGMTHYMELLAVHQPRNLIIFMAVPVVLAETLAITELAIRWRHAYCGCAPPVAWPGCWPTRPCWPSSCT